VALRPLPGGAPHRWPLPMVGCPSLVVFHKWMIVTSVFHKWITVTCGISFSESFFINFIYFNINESFLLLASLFCFFAFAMLLNYCSRTRSLRHFWNVISISWSFFIRIPKGPGKVTWNNFHYAYVFMGNVFYATDGHMI
jgi:hypothetical protein